MATNKDTKSAAGWHKVKPHTESERKSLRKHHGDRCFLMPGEYKYPVCDKNGDFDCRGIVAAKFWADTAETKAKKRTKKRPYSFRKVSNSAKSLGAKLGCAAYDKKHPRNQRKKTRKKIV